MYNKKKYNYRFICYNFNLHFIFAVPNHRDFAAMNIILQAYVVEHLAHLRIVNMQQLGKKMVLFTYT